MSGIEQAKAQGEFFAVVARVAPAVIEDLAGEPMRLARMPPAALEAWDKLKERLVPLLIETLEKLGGPFERFEDAANLEGLLRGGLLKTAKECDRRWPERADSVHEMAEAEDAAIEAWCKKWNLTAPWFTPLAYGILEHWVRHPEALEKRALPPDLCAPSPTAVMLLPGEIELPAIDWNQSEDRWRHGRERRRDARQRLLAKVAGVIDTYLDRVEKVASERRYKEKPELNQHLEWLARYQVKGESEYSISKGSKRERSTVQAALKSTAALIGLERRPANPRGRPKRKAG